MSNINKTKQQCIIGEFLNEYKKEVISNSNLNSKLRLKDKKLAMCRLEWIERHNQLKQNRKAVKNSLQRINMQHKHLCKIYKIKNKKYKELQIKNRRVENMLHQLQVKELYSFNFSSEKHQLVNEIEELKKKIKEKDQKEKLYLRSLGCIDLCTTNIDLTKEN